MPSMDKRNHGSLPVQSLHSMLGHGTQHNTPAPVERLDHALGKGGTKKASGKGLSMSGMHDTHTEVNIPSVGKLKSAAKKQLKQSPKTKRK